MTSPRRFFFLTPLVILLIVLVLISISLGESNIRTNNKNISMETNITIAEASSFFYTGLILGSLVVLELVLVIQVIRRRIRRKKSLEQESIAEERRQEMRGALIGKLDLLLDRYNKTAQTVRASRIRVESLLLTDEEGNNITNAEFNGGSEQ
jgi:uncharacterized membrane protein YciS (DUF1049 family)